MASNPFQALEPGTRPGLWSDPDLDGLDPPEPQPCRRCSAVHCVEGGPWVGTLVWCMRRSGHAGEHLTALGDVGTPEYWEEIWEGEAEPGGSTTRPG